MDWDPISTAPRDGTPFVFVHSDGSGADVVFWWDDGDGGGFYDTELEYSSGADDFDSWIPLSPELESGARHWIKLAMEKRTKKPAEA